MSSKNIESGLTSINNHLVRMAQLAEIQINNAIEALITKNMALADEVKASDGVIDDLQKDGIGAFFRKNP